MQSLKSLGRYNFDDWPDHFQHFLKHFICNHIRFFLVFLTLFDYVALAQIYGGIFLAFRLRPHEKTCCVKKKPSRKKELTGPLPITVDSSTRILSFAHAIPATTLLKQKPQQ